MGAAVLTINRQWRASPHTFCLEATAPISGAFSINNLAANTNLRGALEGPHLKGGATRGRSKKLRRTR